MASPFDEWQRGLDDRGLALEQALELAYGGGLRLHDVEYSGTGELVFIFKRELKSIDEAWRFLFGVGSSAATDPASVAWFQKHPEMEIARQHCRRSGARFTISKGAKFAFARLRPELKHQYPFLARLEADLSQGDLTRGQKAFASCFTKRFDAGAYISCLMSKARTDWQKLAGSKFIIGGISRLGLEAPRQVRALDRLRVLAVLNAWAQDGSYMDRVLFTGCHDFRPRLPAEKTKAFTTEACEHFRIVVNDYTTAEKLLSMPAFHRGSYNCVPTPGAILRFKEIFESEGSTQRILRDYTRIFGNTLGTEVPNIDDFFTSLLDWDGNHCYGLLLELKKSKDWARQGDGELPELAQAAWQWVHRQYRTGALPYAAYPLVDDEDDLLNDLLNLDFSG